MKAMYVSKEISTKKIIKLNKKHKDIAMIVISKLLKENKEFMEDIKFIDIPIADGRWLFKLLVVQVLEYIANMQKRRINNLNIAFMVDNNSDLVNYYIKKIINNVKTLRIITNNRLQFEKIERELFENTGSVLIISNNKKKALKDIDIAINFDFDEGRINRFNLNSKMIIINLKKKVNIKSKLFEGINANYYDINFKSKTISIFKWLKDFENTDIYESYLYQKTKIDNLIKIIINDNVKIKYLIGDNGKISEREYINLLDKRNNLS